MISSTPQETIAQWRQWCTLALAHTRQAQECNQLAQAALQGYATVKGQAAGVVVGAVYGEDDRVFWQVTNLSAQIDSGEDGRQRIVVFVQLCAVDGQGRPIVPGVEVELLLDKWDSTRYRATDIVGDPIELIPF